MGLYAIGDLHLSLGTNKPMDIFNGWDNYVDKLVQNWNDSVSETDTVVIVGDISWAMSLSEAERDFDFINNKLNGNKIILKGNHDYWWNTASKMRNFLDEKDFQKIRILSNNAYSAEGISVVGTRGWINETDEPHDAKVLAREAGRLELSIKEGLKLNDEIVAFIHYPPIFGADENYHITDILQKYAVKRCFYGHLHGNSCKIAFSGTKYGCRFSLVSADYLRFKPYKII